MPEQDLPSPIKIKIAELLGYSFTFSVLNRLNKKWYTTLQEYHYGSSVISVYICQKTSHMAKEEKYYCRERFFQSAATDLNRVQFFISDIFETSNKVALQHGQGCHVFEVILPIRYLKAKKDRSLHLDEDYKIECGQIKTIYLNGDLVPENRSVNNPFFNITKIDLITQSLNKAVLQPKTDSNKSEMVNLQINQNQKNKCLIM